MKALAKFILALVVAAVAVWLVRALAFTQYNVDGDGFAPIFRKGDRILINRWSYGLRTGGKGSLFPYARLVYQPVEKGDIVAFNLSGDSLDGVFIARCTAIPGDTLSFPAQTIIRQGDTIRSSATTLIVPGLITCAPENQYWLEAIAPGNPIDSRRLGFIPESNIIGRVIMVVYNHNDSLNIFQGYDPQRWLITNYDKTKAPSIAD